MKRAFLYFAVIATGCAAALALRVRVGTELQSHGGGAYVPTLFVGMYASFDIMCRRHAKERHVCATHLFMGWRRDVGATQFSSTISRADVCGNRRNFKLLPARGLAVAGHVFLQFGVLRVELQGQQLDPDGFLVTSAGVIGLRQRIDESGFFPLRQFDCLAGVLECSVRVAPFGVLAGGIEPGQVICESALWGSICKASL